jgi:predicted nucleotidyltransferase component of viral defense system
MHRSVREAVEIAHIVFLAELGTKLGKDRYAVKGGCNLRFFFNSPRYSEDLDLDVGGVPVRTLQSNVQRVLTGRSFRLTLATAGIELTGHSAPKQTETTQRWKLQLRAQRDVLAHTKVEFSRRTLDPGRTLDRIEPTLIVRYKLSPVLVSHYGRATALLQKARALAGRTETQARDVFDLDLLLGDGTDPLLHLPAEERGRMTDSALSLDYATFKSQVVAYLPADQHALYDSPEVWERMVLRVVTALGGGGS